MSSLDHAASIVSPTRRALLAGLVALPLAGCLTPMYGPGPGAGLEQGLRAIRVEEVAVAPASDVVAHQLRQELTFALDGTGAATTVGDKRYSLRVTVAVSTVSPIVDATTLRASVSTLTGSARYSLVTIEGEREIDAGTVTGTATFERPTQRFAAVRARRDAEIRLADTLAQEIKTRVAVGLRSAGGV